MENAKKSTGKHKQRNRGRGGAGGGGTGAGGGGNSVGGGNVSGSGGGFKQTSSNTNAKDVSNKTKNNSATNNNNARRKKQRRRGGGGNNVRHNPAPSLKITVRNISNINPYTDSNNETNGTQKNYKTCEGLCAGFIRILVQRTNEKLEKLHQEALSAKTSVFPKFIPIGLDENQINRIVMNEKAAMQAKAEWEALQQVALTGSEAPKESKDYVEEEAVKNDEKENTAMKPELPKPLVESNTEKGIHARVLYILPPKKTRRSGEKPGCAYFVLTAPPMPPAVVKKESIVSKVPSSKGIQIVSPGDPTTISVSPDDPTPSGEKNGGGNDSTTSSNKKTTKTKLVIPNNKQTQNNASNAKEKAKQRLLLFLALEAMVAVAAEDAKNSIKTGAPPLLAGCVIEESKNVKTWKEITNPSHGYRHSRDRLEGTIFDNADYKEFLENQAKEKEERMSRPKPTPGGGMITAPVTSEVSTSVPSQSIASTSLPTAEVTNQPPVAALVLHLQQKQEEEKQRKLQQAKQRAATNNTKKEGANASNSKNPKKTENVVTVKKKTASHNVANGANGTIKKKKNIRKRGAGGKVGTGGKAASKEGSSGKDAKA